MNKKGFTLIELLAVILILGIIALIAIPVVTNIVKEAKQGAFKTTVQNLEKAAVLHCQRNQINDKDTIDLSIVEGELNVDIDIKGELPTEGYLNYDNNCNVEYSFSDGVYKAEKGIESDKIIITECSIDNPCNYGIDMLANDPLRHCFDFDASTKTLKKYKKTLATCPFEIIIPDLIEGVRVEKIGNVAFTKVNEIMCLDENNNWVNKDPNYYPEDDDRCSIYAKFVNDDYQTVEDPMIKVTLPRYVTEIKTSSFYANHLTTINYPKSLKIIGSGAFNRNLLTSAHLPDTIEKVGFGAFGYNMIKDFTWPSKINYLPASVFSANPFDTIRVPDHIKRIEGSAFSSTTVKNLILPEGLEFIGSAAFFLNNIESYNIPSTVTEIQPLAFSGGGNAPDDIAFVYDRKSDGTEDRTKIIGYLGAKKANVIVPSQVKIIRERAFDYCDLTSITLNEGLEKVESEAFIRNQLTSITIPSTVTSLELGSFWIWSHSNRYLRTISNKTNRSFNWGVVLDADNANQTFVTGTATTRFGNVNVTN